VEHDQTFDAKICVKDGAVFVALRTAEWPEFVRLAKPRANITHSWTRDGPIIAIGTDAQFYVANTSPEKTTPDPRAAPQ
jgi:hypothetical protein